MSPILKVKLFSVWDLSFARVTKQLFIKKTHDFVMIHSFIIWQRCLSIETCTSLLFVVCVHIFLVFALLLLAHACFLCIEICA